MVSSIPIQYKDSNKEVTPHSSEPQNWNLTTIYIRAFDPHCLQKLRLLYEDRFLKGSNNYINERV